MFNQLDHWIRNIRAARSEVEWRTIRDQFQESLVNVSLHLNALELNQSVNDFHDTLISVIAEWSIKETERQTGIPAPSAYAFVLFGSGGRREQTPWSDQDNGIVYEPVAAEMADTASDFFLKAANIWSNQLMLAGYPPCVGNVLCTNPQWCKPADEWQTMIDEWWERCHWEDVRYLLICADARVITGDVSIWQRIRNAYLKRIQHEPELLTAMLRNTLHHKISLGIFGHFLTERYGVDAGGIDLKYGGYIPIVNAIRLLAVRHHIGASSTLERLQALEEFYPLDKINAWREAFLVMLYWRSNTTFEMEDGAYTSSGKIKVRRLPAVEQRSIKQALREGMNMQVFLRQSLNYKKE